MTMRRLLLLSACLVAVGGCGNGRPPVYSVHGQVLDSAGKPAVGALIVLHPVAPPSGFSKEVPKPLAMTDETGRFSLTTYVQGDGAPAGEYKATVVWQRPRRTPLDPVGPDLLNGRFANPERSTIRFIVEAKSENEMPPIRLQ